MNWENVLGQERVKKLLQQTLTEGRVSHAQIIAAPKGSGALAMALAYAQAILCLDREESCFVKVRNLQHPDLHLFFPNTSTSEVKSDRVESKHFVKRFREFFLTNPYGNLSQWMEFLGAEKKQGSINVRDAQTLIRNLSLKSYEGGYKVALIWLPELMNISTSNKLLKMIEEPPEKTVILLATEQSADLLDTIRSRCQEIQLAPLSAREIARYLIQEKQIDSTTALRLSEQVEGDLNKAVLLARNGAIDAVFEAQFIQWVRLAFQAKKKVSALEELVDWANEIAEWGREKQKDFLCYCLQIFRQALLGNYQIEGLAYNPVQTSFNWSSFSAYIHGANIQDILEELNQAHYHIERNANPKILFLDSSIKLTRFLHKKA